MKKVEDYRAHSDECRRLASRARLHEDKSTLMNMAATWDSFAVTEQAHIDRQEGMVELAPAAGSIPIDRLNASNDE